MNKQEIALERRKKEKQFQFAFTTWSVGITSLRSSSCKTKSVKSFFFQGWRNTRVHLVKPSSIQISWQVEKCSLAERKLPSLVSSMHLLLFSFESTICCWRPRVPSSYEAFFLRRRRNVMAMQAKNFFFGSVCWLCNTDQLEEERGMAYFHFLQSVGHLPPARLFKLSVKPELIARWRSFDSSR